MSLTLYFEMSWNGQTHLEMEILKFSLQSKSPILQEQNYEKNNNFNDF